MAAVNFASNGFLSFGEPIGAVLRCTTDISLELTSNAKATPTTTGEVGFSSGVSMGSLSTTVSVEIGSAQQLALLRVYQDQTPVNAVLHAGGRKHPFFGIIDSVSISSRTNEVIEYAIKMTGKDGAAL